MAPLKTQTGAKPIGLSTAFAAFFQVARLTPFLLLSMASTSAGAENACDAATPPDVACTCDLGVLRPLQGAVGWEEVKDKERKIKKNLKKAQKKLAADPIKVVRGPGGALFITDHHHGADAWRTAGYSVALCQIINRPPFASEAEFWAGLIKDHLVRLADAEGKPIAPAQLPTGLAGLPDDPYRSLAWRLRKKHGFCRSEMPQKEFAEFVWADWLRTRSELPAEVVRGSAAKILPRAIALAKSPDAKDVPGYIGDKPANFTCADDD